MISNKVLFIGTFYHEKKGSISRAEELKENLKDDFSIELCSHFENKILRIFHIIITLFSFKGHKVVIDTYSGQAFLMSEIALWISKFRKKKVVLILRGGMLGEFHQKNTKRVERLIKKAYRTYSPSLFLIEYFNIHKIEVGYLSNWVNFNYFQYDRNNVKPYSLLWVRAFTQIYNPWLPIKVVNLLKEKYPEISLTMIGPDKGLLGEIQELIEELGVGDYVHVLGAIPNKELNKFYQSHSIYLNTTSYESFGVAIVEAAACGIPIVSTNVGEIPLMWHDQSEILIANKIDEIEFREKVIQILEQKDLSILLSKNANDKAKKYDWLNVKQSWIKVLTE